MVSSPVFSALVFSFLAAMAQADTPPEAVRFALCAERVAAVEVVPPRKRLPAWSVIVQLTPRASSEFAKLTRRNVGRTLEITAGDDVFVRATLRGAIRSGTIGHAGYQSEAEARDARQVVASVGACPKPRG